MDEIVEEIQELEKQTGLDQVNVEDVEDIIQSPVEEQLKDIYISL